MKWFKFYGQDFLSDMKMSQLSVAERLYWVTLMCLAHEEDREGNIRYCTEDLVKLKMGIQKDNREWGELTGVLNKFESLEMVEKTENGIFLKNFTKRQETNLTPSEKMARYRDKKEKSNKSYPSKVTKVTSNRIEKKREEEKGDETFVSTPTPPLSSEVGPEPMDFEAFMAERGFEHDSRVDGDSGEGVEWWVNLDTGKKLSKSELRKMQIAYEGHLNGLKSAKTKKAEKDKAEAYDFDNELEKLRTSDMKARKIIALVWVRKGYKFINYAQFKTQYEMDFPVARKLEGYTGGQISETIDFCEDEGRKLGYVWSINTVAKKIANVVA